MSKKNEGWIGRRGQTAADIDLERIVELKPGESIRQIPDTDIDDSPAQVREAFSDASLEGLVQSMLNSGFAGVVLVRPHPNRAGHFELVFGHRRRAAWHLVCREQKRECLLPAIVRPTSDREMLLQGATENLARENLSLREECALVARLLKEFYPQGQDDIAKMIGKTRGWIAPRARVNGLPQELRERLWRRTSALSHILELAVLYQRDREGAMVIAARIVDEDLPLSAVRNLIAQQEEKRVDALNSDDSHKSNDANQIVPRGTSAETEAETTTVREHNRTVSKHSVEAAPMLATCNDYAGNDGVDRLQRTIQLLTAAADEAFYLSGPELFDALRGLIDQSLAIARQAASKIAKA